MNLKEFSKIFKIEITFLVDLVAVAAFFSNPAFSSKIIYIVPLLISGTLGSMSAALFNNIYDMDIDSGMKRTRTRKDILNSGNYWSYFLTGILMLAGSGAISFFLINPLTSLFIILGFVSYVFLYTMFLKRRTVWNIVIGGVAGSFPALAGWAAISNDVSLTSLFIAGLVFLWTPTHFWSLAVNNVEDYRGASLPMLPAKIGIKESFGWIFTNTIVLIIYSLLPLFTGAIHVGVYYIILAVLMDGLLLYLVIRPKLNNFSLKYFRQVFHYSNFYLMFLLISISFVSIR